MAKNNDEETCLGQSSSSPPHESLFFVLAYLPLLQLLSMTQVCKSLRDAINNDILPWMNIIVEPPLSSRVTDDILMEIVSKAKGRLKLLALINCVKITDDGLLRIVEQNPRIDKLHVPGCTSLSPQGLIKSLKLLSQNNHKLHTLKINGIYSVHIEHLQTLHNLITHNHTQNNKILYHEFKKSSTPKHATNTRPIDIEICPKCDEVRMVFDCPRVQCTCRACDLCITRCIECGMCLRGSGEEIEECCCEDMVCLDCWFKLPKCDFCNKPYCNMHADLQHEVVGSMGFVCDACYLNFG